MKPFLVLLVSVLLLVVIPAVLVYKGNFMPSSKNQYFGETIAACAWGALSLFIIQILFHLEF